MLHWLSNPRESNCWFSSTPKYLTKYSGYFPACVHRVVGTTSRQSIVFKMRAPSSAVLDIEAYQCPELTNRIPRYHSSKKETVENWMSSELSGTGSVNFPGKSKGNYHRLIIYPNLNLANLRETFSGRRLL